MKTEIFKTVSIIWTIIIAFFILATPTIAASSIENPSSHLTLNILNETTAFVDWYIHCPGEYAVYLPLERKRLEKNIGDLEKGIEQLLLQDVQNIKITQENETLLITFNLKGDYTNGFVTGKCQYLPELVKYAPIGLNVLKVVIPKDKTLSMVDPGPNGMEGNELTFYDYNWIYPIEISYYAEKDYSGKAVTTVIGKEWQIPQLEVFSVEDIETSVNGANNYSKFAIPDDWVGTGDGTPVGTTETALKIANDYKPRLYLNTDQCPNAVYYRVIKGYDPYIGFDAYLIQYFAYWRCQDCAPACHEYDYEPIFIWVRNIGERPYRVAYDHWGGILDWHVHEIHRTYLWSSLPDNHYPMPSGVFTQHKAYYPFGRSEYDQDGVDDIYLWNLSSSLQSNWDGNHVKLGIANCYHTFDTDTSGSYCGDYPLSHLDDDQLVTWYRNEIDDDDPCDVCDCDWWESWKVMPFKYDISDPFYGVFWEDRYGMSKEYEFPTLSTAIDSALVDNGVLTVNVSAFYDNTDAGGSSGNDLRGLWKDRFTTSVDNNSIGNPYSLNESDAGKYTLEFDVSGIGPDTYTLALSVTDNLDYTFAVDYETVVIQNNPPTLEDCNGSEFVWYTQNASISPADSDGILDYVGINASRFTESVNYSLKIRQNDTTIYSFTGLNTTAINESWYGNFTNGTMVDDGIYTVELFASDMAGNNITTTLGYVTVDNTPPYFTTMPALLTNIISPTTSPGTNDSTAITANFSEPVGWTICAINSTNDAVSVDWCGGMYLQTSWNGTSSGFNTSMECQNVSYSSISEGCDVIQITSCPPPSPPSGGGGGGTYPAPWHVFPDGEYTISIVATDWVGNNVSYALQVTLSDSDEYLRGDLNGDGDITPADALICLQIAAGSREYDAAADVSDDGPVTSLDALMILQVAAGSIGIG